MADISEDKELVHALSLLAIAFDIMGRIKTLPEMLQISTKAACDADCAQATGKSKPATSAPKTTPSKASSSTSSRSNSQKKWDRMGKEAKEKALAREQQFHLKKSEGLASRIANLGTAAQVNVPSLPENDPLPSPHTSTAEPDPMQASKEQAHEKTPPPTPEATAKRPGEKRTNSERTPTKAPDPNHPDPSQRALGSPPANLEAALIKVIAPSNATGDALMPPPPPPMGARAAVRRAIAASTRWRGLVDCTKPNVLERVLCVLSLEITPIDQNEWSNVLKQRLGKVAGRICGEEGVWIGEGPGKKLKA